jgi:ABC-2 type transport system ATP-binding protein
MESVEELCDNIALINKSKKILDGAVSEIKAAYRNNTYSLCYEGDYTLASNDIFELIRTENQENLTTVKLKLNEGHQINEILFEILPKVNIHRVEEVIPTMNDIFIEKVKGGTSHE